MKKTLFNLTILCLCSAIAIAQIKPEKYKPFTGRQEIISISGPGSESASGDLLLELKDEESPDIETLMLLQNTQGKLRKIAENENLIMGREILGVSGGNYPALEGPRLSVAYTIGSNSAQSDISIVFEKNGNNNYDFVEYTSVTRNYGVENLFARQRITAQQTGKIDFSEASELKILNKAKVNPLPDDADQPVNEATQGYVKYIPPGWQLAAFATGDLNTDSYKKDLLLILYNEEHCHIRLLLQQKNGNYRMAATNRSLIVPDGNFNIKNLRAVIKNGYGTVEQRTAIDDNDFDHRYITFRYSEKRRNWYLYRYDVERFSGFDTIPLPDATHLTRKNFGEIPFEKLDYTPGDYQYEPSVSTISGTLIKKQFYGRPDYGKTPEKDELVYVYILKPDYPVNVFAAPNQPDPETADKTVRDVTEIQVYSIDKSLNLSKYLDKKVILKGTLMPAQTGGQYTKMIMQTKQLVQ